MNYKNTSMYVQKQMNNLMKSFRNFARAYIDDVMIFNNSLKKHLNHLNKIFQLFDNCNITFKTKKIYLKYSFIFFFDQKIDSLRLTTIDDKLKTITFLFFPKTLKALKTYLSLIDYFKNYIFYYVQKAEFLQKRKTMLLKKKSVQKSFKKTFNLKTNIKEFISKKIKTFNQLQIDFNRFS